MVKTKRIALTRYGLNAAAACALAAGIMAGGGAEPSGQLTLETSACQTDDEIVVELWMRNILNTEVTGFQAFVAFDRSSLVYRGDLSSYTASPFPLHMTRIADAELGHPGRVDLDGSIDFGGSGTDADSLLATLVFEAISVGECATSLAITFIPQVGPFLSELSFEGAPMVTSLQGTPSFIFDGVQPTLVAPDDVEVRAGPGQDPVDIDPGDPTVVDNCPGAIAVSCARSDGLDCFDDPYSCGTTTLTWSATDGCENSRTDVQLVTVTCEACARPTVRCFASSVGDDDDDDGDDDDGDDDDGDDDDGDDDDGDDDDGDDDDDDRQQVVFAQGPSDVAGFADKDSVVECAVGTPETGPARFVFSLGDGQTATAAVTRPAGRAILTLDPVSLELEWDITYELLSSPLAGAAFHVPSGPKTGGTVALDVSRTILDFSGAGTIYGSTFLDPTQAADLRDGRWSLILATVMYPAGEISGKVTMPVDGGCLVEVGWDAESPADCALEVEAFVVIGGRTIPVENGDIVRLDCGPAAVGASAPPAGALGTGTVPLLVVNVEDSEGNVASCELELCSFCQEDDDDDDDDDDGDDDDGDDDDGDDDDDDGDDDDDDGDDLIVSPAIGSAGGVAAPE